jgi:hypothetical protein
MIASKSATHSPVIALSSQSQYRFRPPVGASSVATIRSPGSRVCCRITSEVLFWSARCRRPRWPRFNEASSDDAPVTFAELSILWARMRRLPATSTHLHPQAACQGRKYQRHDLEQGVNNCPLGREDHPNAPSRCSKGFFAPSLYGRGRLPERDSEGRRTVFVDLPSAYDVIDKRDDAHWDFRLDFRDAIAHCDLVQGNNGI